MTERYNVAANAVLGENYKITSIECSDYNPNIDNSITITITVTDAYGDAISGESVTVTASEGNFTQLNGSNITNESSVSGTTNSSGQFTLTYSCTAWGLITFSANTTSTQVRVNGWKEIDLNNSYCTLFVNKAERICQFNHSRGLTSIQANNVYTWFENLIPSDYRPTTMITGSFNYLGTIMISTTGTVSGIFVNAYSGSTRTFNASAMWRY